MEEKDSKNDSDLKRKMAARDVEEKQTCNKAFWLNRVLIIVVYLVILLIFIIMRQSLHTKHIELLEWLKINAYSGPIIIMFIALVESAFFMPIDLLTLGTGLSLQLAHEESFKPVFVGSLAIWTGYWIGINLNAQLLKFLFRDKVQTFFNKYLMLRCLDKAAENHGLKVLLFMRLSPVFAINLLIQLMSLTGISYKNFVLGGFSAFVPIIITVI